MSVAGALSSTGPSRTTASPADEPGLVVAAHGRHVMVEDAQGARHLCHARGRKADIVVGDLVRWAVAGDGGVVEEVLPRRNLLFRQDEWRTKSFAANLDLILILVAVEPPYAETQLTRALIAAQQAGVPAVVGLNKVDLPGAPAARERLAPYRAMGVQVVELALKHDPEGARASLMAALQGRKTLVLGPSGMGKSTLINRLVPAAQAQEGEISTALNTGRHTTTSTTLYWMDDTRHTALLDSPGFQQFGLRQVEPEHLAQAMPDFVPFLGHCRFYNCSHRHEPGCAVQQAVREGLISASRLRIHGELYEELSQKRWD